jgi:predicted metalloprotease
MNRLLLLVALTLSSLLASLGPAGPASAQDDERDLREATFSAGEILRLAYERKFNAMYDRIHPDAHEVIPRVAAVAVFEQVYEETNAGEATITGSQLMRWTWPVTGKTYDRAAEISFEQPYTDSSGQKQLLRDRMYLVNAEGEWRWFFGSSREFVDAAIAQYGGPQGEPLVEGDLVQNVANDLDAFYRDVLSYTDFRYESPGFVYVQEGESVNTGCGRADTGFWAFFCPVDVTIYVDASLITALEDEADFAAAFVIAHEWAHHVQTLVTFERVQSSPDAWNEVWSIELELMADCMAGAWALDVDTRGLLETDDIDEAVRFTISYLGDPAYIGEYDPQAHGSADQRVQSFLNGYENGFLGCNVVI